MATNKFLAKRNAIESAIESYYDTKAKENLSHGYNADFANSNAYAACFGGLKALLVGIGSGTIKPSEIETYLKILTDSV